MAWVLYTIALTAIVFTGFGAFLDELRGDQRLVVISEAELKSIAVTYDGREVRPEPGFLSGRVPPYVTFAPMRAPRVFEPVLEVSWETQSGTRGTVKRPMRKVDDPRCLFVLRLDAAAVPIDAPPHDRYSPFWWNCHWR